MGQYVAGYLRCSVIVLVAFCAHGNSVGSTQDGTRSAYTMRGTLLPRDQGVCFTSTSMVELDDGERKPMWRLAPGDRVRVSSDKFSEVYYFGYRCANAVGEFVKITTEGRHSITLSGSNYIYVNDKLGPSVAVKRGDLIESASGEKKRVHQVEYIRTRGFYSPYTIDGDIVVDGFKATCNTQYLHPTVAKYFLYPLRILYQLGFSTTWFIEISRESLAKFLCLPSNHISIQAEARARLSATTRRAIVL